MGRAGLALLAVAGTFLLSGAAQAKAPPGGMDVCGPSACTHLDWATAEQFWIGSQSGGGPNRASPGPFYVLRWHWDPATEESAYLVPGASAIRWNAGPGHPSSWGAMARSASELVTRAAGAVEPYPVPPLTRVTVGGRVVRDPQSYLRLLSGKPTWAWINGRWLSVEFASPTPNPWTDGTAIVRLSRSRPYVEIDGWFYKLPKSVVRRARLALSLNG
jgi:hypothetical protein